MDWTEKQKEAIELRDKNILVAAAAGSGKTAVLVERIKRLILEDGVSLDDMLIVTFTNAAAAEMKEKIVKAIVRQIEDEPERAAFLRAQLGIVYRANISTFHAFALEVIRRYFYVIDIDPSFRVCDEAEGELLRAQAADLLFEEYFERQEPRFFDFLDSYSTAKGFENVKELIVSSHNKLQSIPEPYEWLFEHTEALGLSEEEFRRSATYELMMSEIYSSLTNAAVTYGGVCALLDEEGCSLLSAKAATEAFACAEAALKAQAKDYDAVSELMSAFPSVRLAATKNEKEAYNRIKEAVKELRKEAASTVKEIRSGFCAYPLAKYVEELNRVYPQARIFQELLVRFAEIYGEEKRKKGVIDFADIEHYALKILKSPDISEEYREKFKYIFIDEYQDSNLIQDTLIGYIKRENNLFMVGDVKQSIYKFRLAEPELFMRKYEDFAAGGEADARIDLNMNFRSKEGIISFTNDLFREAMAGYDELAALYKGTSYCGELEYETELHILCKEEDGVELPEEIEELKSAEREAAVCAKIISESIGRPIYDVKREIERPLCKKDIVVLMRSAKNNAGIFRKALEERGIEAHVDDSEGYFDTVEIEIFLNLLRVIDNKRQDIPLISVLHSDIFGFSADELAEIRLTRKGCSYFDALTETAEGESAIAERCREVLSSLRRLKAIAGAMTLPELFWRLMCETGFYTYCGAMPGGMQRQANLRAMIDKAQDFSAGHAGGIYEFLSYVEKLRKRKVNVPQVKLVSEEDDVVRIMTVHKSKGLEYPFVIVAGLGKRFNRGTRERVTVHKDVGIGLTLSDYNEHWHKKTMVQKLIETKQKKEEAEEELRILYVACTRAMDKLVLLGSLKKTEEDVIRKAYRNAADIYGASCYLDIIMPAVHGKVNTIFHHMDSLPTTAPAAAGNEDAMRDILNGESADEAVFAEIDRRLSYAYPYETQGSVKSKYAVTELTGRSAAAEETPALNTPVFLTGKKGFTAAERGTVYHSVMEYISFAEAARRWEEGGRESLSQYVAGAIEEMTEREILLSEEAAAVEIDKISAFITSDIGLRAARAQRNGKLHKEKPFVLKVEREGAEVLVQGVIDCWFEEDGRAVLLDYKTSRIPDAEDAERALIEKYRGQMTYYAEAIEKIKGTEVGEKYLYLLESSRLIEIR